MEQNRFKPLLESKLIKHAAVGLSIISLSAIFLYPPKTTATLYQEVVQQPTINRTPLVEHMQQPLQATLEPVFKPTPMIELPLPNENLNSDDGQKRLQQLISFYENTGEEVANNEDIVNIFSRIHNIPQKDVQQSLKLYYPIYRLAQQQSGVHWGYLAIIHASETRFSQDPEPGRSGFVGAMQRTRELYPDEQVIEYSNGLEFLETRFQRYNEALSTNASKDYREILWAGKHIKQRSQEVYPYLPEDEAIRLVVLNNYSADGNSRIWLYDQLKSTLKERNLI